MHHRRPYRACFHADAHIAVSVSPPARRYERLPEEEIAGQTHDMRPRFYGTVSSQSSGLVSRSQSMEET